MMVVRALGAILVAIILAPHVLATDVRFVGQGTFNISGAQVEVTFSRLQNFDQNTTSGTLYLQLWASPDNDPAGSGYELTPALNLSGFTGLGNGTLRPNAAFENITFSAPYTAPPQGSYHVFLVVFEFPNLNSFLDSAPAVNNPHQLGGTPGNTGGGGSNNLELDCLCSWSLNGGVLSIAAERVINNRSGGLSGTLKLKLWATETPYTGGTITGYVMGEVNLGQLAGGFFRGPIDQQVSYRRPPNGTYFVALTLTEFDGEDRTVDWVSFSNTHTVGGGAPPPPPPPPPPPSGSIDLGCPCTYRVSGDFVDLEVDELTNTRSTRSGSLRLELWATRQAYPGFGTITGTVFAQAVLDPLEGGFRYTDIDRSLVYNRPASGDYFVTLTVSEFTGTGWSIVGSVNFEGMLNAAPAPVPFPIITPGVGGGGGGSADLLFVLLMLGIGLRRKRFRFR
ncbi:MAG: hypothetical protein AAF610_00555 [Pseudomonadota bacterium]